MVNNQQRCPSSEAENRTLACAQWQGERDCHYRKHDADKEESSRQGIDEEIKPVPTIWDQFEGACGDQSNSKRHRIADQRRRWLSQPKKRYPNREPYE